MAEVSGPESERAGRRMQAEIAEQPAVFERILGSRRGLEDIGRDLGRRAPRMVLLAARGTSDNAALYGKYLAETVLPLPAGLVSPSSFGIYRARPDLTGALFIAVSQSGRSPDLLTSLQAARECGAYTLALTNDASSELATAAHRHLDIDAGPELSVAATKTYTAELLCLYLVFHAMAEQGTPALASLPEAAAATLDQAEPISRAAQQCAAQRVVVTGRGYSYPTAKEAALKLMETCYLSAHAFSGADLLHGPLAMLDASVPVVAICPPGAAGQAMHPVVEAVRGTGAPLLTVGHGRDLDVVAPDLPEAVLPMLEILPLQRMACRLAVSLGGDPDRPRGLHKVTLTR